MSHQQVTVSVKAELDRLTSEFFAAVSFEPGTTPAYERIRSLFIDSGLLIKNVGAEPEISTVQEFIEPRDASVCGEPGSMQARWKSVDQFAAPP